MADIEKVIKGLEICSEHGSWHGLDCELNEAYKDCPYRGCETGCIVTIAKDAIELLKKQEAVKPRSVVRHGANAQIQHFCGNCNTMLHGKPNYCSKCGKGILW